MSGWYIVDEQRRTLLRVKNSSDSTQWLATTEVRCFIRCGYRYKGRVEQRVFDPCTGENLDFLSACVEFLGVPEGVL